MGELSGMIGRKQAQYVVNRFDVDHEQSQVNTLPRGRLYVEVVIYPGVLLVWCMCVSGPCPPARVHPGHGLESKSADKDAADACTVCAHRCRSGRSRSRR